MGKRSLCRFWKVKVKDHISNTKLEKGTNTAQQSFFPLESYSKKILRKKCPGRRSYKQTKCAHAPWASYNTP